MSKVGSRLTTRRRLDTELVRRGLAADTTLAIELINQHRVLVEGALATNATRMVSAADSVHVEAPPARFVSRGGLKLEAAIERFALSVAGKHALDAGASTGGFTDCLLQYGAASVVAVDVGRAQLHERIRRDARVEVHEQTDIRDFTSSKKFDLVVGDLSFISLKTVAAALVDHLALEADLVLLVKPQFEAKRSEATTGRGVITDPDIWRRVISETLSATHAHGTATMGVMASPIRGGEGNVEFLVHLRPGNFDHLDTESAIASAVSEACK